MNRRPSAVPLIALLAVAAFLLAAAVGCGGDGIDQTAPPPPADAQRQPEPAPPAAAQPQQSAPQQTQLQEQPSDAPQQSAQADEPPDEPPPVQQDTPQQRAEPTAVPTAQALPALAVEPILGGYRFEQPIELLTLLDGSFLVAEQRGSITRFLPADDADGEPRQFGVLDLTDAVTFGGERGLLSLALDPDFESQPYLYVYYSPRGTDLSRLSRFELRDGAALSASELLIIEFEQPFANHNGGAVRFGPDGMLYLGLGDGGAANDPLGHGQNTQTLLGGIIRIDVRNSSAATPYRIPVDNPFLGRAGFRPELWAYGLRNPWRMAFDSRTGLLWVGDVGQDRFEEIAVVQAGENHGWNTFEGADCFAGQAACDALADAVPPVAVYPHPDGCSVTGGIVYRGAAIPALQGRYIFGDYCAGAVWTIESGGVRETGLELDARIASFAVDADGEIYVLVFHGPILKLVAE